MDFHEIEGKTLFKRFGIPTEVGFLLTSEMNPDMFAYPCVVKAQVLAGHRGQAGGVKFAKTPDELKTHAENISKLTIGGKRVEAVMISPMLSIDKELYLGMVLDTVSKKVLMIFSPCGGMEIEELAIESPEKLVKFDCTEGFDGSAFRAAVAHFGLAEKMLISLESIAKKLADLYFALDATTVEINPLAVDAEGELFAADSKLVIDDNALFRQGDYTLIPRKTTASANLTELAAEEADLAYVELDPEGDIGLIAGGAGLGMATVDAIKYYGGRAHNFLDLGGGVTAEKTYAATKLLLENNKITAVIANVFGGINNCETMAQGIVAAMADCKTGKRVIVKSRGHGQENGWKLLKDAGCRMVKYGTTDDAVKLLLQEEMK
ncbi:MAG: ATP-grasp domain-containing protein [Oscillospiraceae bacterium]